MRVQRADDGIDAGFGKRERPLGRGFNLSLPLTIDQAAKPEIECDQGYTDEQHADGNRNKIPAREGAHKQSHSGPDYQPNSRVEPVSHVRRKGRLKLKAALTHKATVCLPTRAYG
jgi:hypothetical protein